MPEAVTAELCKDKRSVGTLELGTGWIDTPQR
jgi:hypothetical protein